MHDTRDSTFEVQLMLRRTMESEACLYLSDIRWIQKPCGERAIALRVRWPGGVKNQTMWRKLEEGSIER